MKGIGTVLAVLMLTAALYAENREKKWIPIEPITSNHVSKLESNTSKLQSGNKTIQNLKIIKNLLDHVNKGGVTPENERTWYSLEPMDDN
ncbi:MAG: hypothetical protein Q8O20_01640 [Sulfuricurvum sp.]|uniref:hypothetical protein n=1 Tax=Sulfuricurvum sp. TaxID=2025608 RepID=UPI00273730BA|nr:hypothetical protein [Sulfuricurvum sp.]MDP2849755.1 hypothetical protein [Sulfuricurvum sp.]